MGDRKQWEKTLRSAIMLPALLLALACFSSVSQAWDGVDEAVVEKVAKEHGREAKPPLLDLSGDLLLFAFLMAGAVGGFVAGYYWRDLTAQKPRKDDASSLKHT
ncbi:cobalt ABC transporter permease [Geomonas terrae]|uniref:Cobalt ABC transporter permease n=1 Tax=Geomonas terrae TaxID=2562681 RepID=A0A4S1CM70_9BACT|nr:cobalt ABC transporter permease [Geomonas terrae]TGU74908.1 cobalt ABC transporter permease [Geomonas terrae]